MYAGRVVELGDVYEIFNSPRHPYTIGLMRSLARLDTDLERLEPIPGQPPSIVIHPRGALSTHAARTHRGARCAGRTFRSCGYSARAESTAPPATSPMSSPRVTSSGDSARSPRDRDPGSYRGDAASNGAGDALLRVEGLVKHFPVKSGVFKHTVGQVHAVDGIDLTIESGETLGVVGESGCGKTTLGRTLIKLIEPTAGRIVFDGTDITTYKRRQMRPIRRDIQIVFQDPYASLNPRMTVREIVAEPLRIHGLYRRGEGQRRVGELLRTVGLSPEHANRFPHEFSGGQRQRIGVARALALNPRLIVLDEPVSALDVSIQAQVVNLLAQLQKEFGLTYLFIAHDLSVVRHVSDRVAVMYLGKIVEVGSRLQIYEAPMHPTLRRSSRRFPSSRRTSAASARIILEGDVPSPVNPPRAAASARAAGRPRRSAPSRSPSSSRARAGNIPLPVTSPRR